MLPRPALQKRQPVGASLLAVPSTLAKLVARQHGVLTRVQLHALGFSASAVRAAIRARRWQAFGRHVVVLSNGALTPAQRWWVAVLLPAKPAALAGLTAAEAAGLRGFADKHVHLVVPHATHVAAPRWITLHESRRFDSADIHPAAAPARTGNARSVIDAAAWSRWPRRAGAILCAAVQQRIVTPTALADELRSAGHVRHAAIMRSLLGDIAGGGHTLAEIEFAPIARRAGLPAPRRQHLRREANGKVRYLDVELDLPDGAVLAVEVDGAAHQQFEQWCDDLDRQNEIVIGGRLILRYPSLVVRLEPHRVEDQLRRIRHAHLR